MAVRKRISGARIAGISLLSKDRILRSAVERKEWKGSIILEMFGRGNLIITEEKMEISARPPDPRVLGQGSQEGGDLQAAEERERRPEEQHRGDRDL